MSVATKIDTLLSFLENKVGSNTNHNLPENLTNLSGFQIDEDLRQTADFMAFKGHFGDKSKPSIMTVRPSKPKPDEFKQFKNRLTLASTGRFGKGFGYYKGYIFSIPSCIISHYEIHQEMYGAQIVQCGHHLSMDRT